MIELFRGKIQLQNPLVAEHAKSHINNKRILDPTEQWYERSIEKFIYWYTEISRIKYPMSAVVGGSKLIGIHPGTSRLVAQYLKGIKSADCIMLCIMHQDSKPFMYDIMPIRSHTCEGERRRRHEHPCRTNTYIDQQSKRTQNHSAKQTNRRTQNNHHN